MSPEMRHELAIEEPHWQDQHGNGDRVVAGAYSVYVVFSPAAQTVKYGSSSSLEGFRHLVESVERDDWCSEAAHVIAVVILQVIHTPRCEARCVLRLIVKGSSVACASQFAGARVHTKQKVLVVESVGHSVHAIWELGFVDDQISIIASSARPAVIENNVVVAEVSEPVVDQ
jgi:hypothetical protein